MRLLNQWQLFLFDFDGLLVNTEEIHFKAYQRTCELHGFTLPWSFDRYCQAAHYEADSLRIQIYEALPGLKKKEPDWQVLYSHKRKEIVKLVDEGAVELMPGVKTLLTKVKESKIKQCVVTHSPDDLVRAIRRQHSILDSIDYWVTRFDYTHPKPHPESYLKAIDQYAGNNDRVIGFEDSPRGLRALMGSGAESILICRAAYPEIPKFLEQGVKHYATLEGWIEDIH